jgi:DnaJ-class molecular chaperone
MDFKDYYKTLGVPKTATEKELKAAFRKLARKHHPDVNPGDKSAESKFKEINEAYEVLGDPDKRKKYDELGANWRAYEQAGGAGNPYAGGSPFGGFGGGGRTTTRTVTPEEFEQMFGGGAGGGFSDFFETFFGGAGGGAGADFGSSGRRGRAPRQGRDVEHELELPLEDALHGTTRRLQMTHNGEVRSVDVRIPAGVGDGSRRPAICICGVGSPRTRGSSARGATSTPRSASR